jgi:predicted RND superfamily exporter protein
MDITDPRLWGVRHPWSMLVCFLALTLLFAWGNVQVEKAGILDQDAILHADDPVLQMHRSVMKKEQDGFAGRDFIFFVLNTGIQSVQDLRRVVQFTDATKDTFGDAVLSLSAIPAYEDTGEVLRDEPYIATREITDPQFDMEAWRAKVARDPDVYGPFVGRDFSWTAVIRYLPPDYDEITEFRRTVEFLEGRTIPWWEWFFKRDIVPQDPTVGVAGWIVGRGLIDQGINVDMLTLIFLGVVLTLPVFWAALGSFRAAFLCVGVMIVGGFIWTRGAMGLLGIHERVYSLLAYANVIVQGTSFALHKFAALRESDTPVKTLGWQHARSIDGLIAMTAGIAVFGFATLWSFGLTPVRELGVVSAIGVLWILLLSVFFLPALHLLVDNQTDARLALQRSRLGQLFDQGLQRLVSGCLRAALWLTRGRRPWGVIVSVCGLFGITAYLFVQGQIVSRTRALEFIRGTLVEREARFLNAPGNMGFDFVDLLVEPVHSGNLHEPDFLQRAWQLQTALRQVAEVRETASILSTLQQISQESFKKEFPETAEEVDAAFFLVESRLSPSIQEQLYFSGGLRLSVSSATTDDSLRLARLCDEILVMARRDFPDLQVSLFNRLSLFPRVDYYVRQGKVTNVFSSQLGIALLCGLFICWRNRRFVTVRLSPVWSGLVMSLPLLFGTAVIGLVMWALEVPLDMATAPIGALTINAATDFSLYLTMTYQQALRTAPPEAALQAALRQEGGVIIADCLLNAVCFLPLVTSHFLPVRQLGWMMGVMLVACAVGALLFMAALLPHCVVRKDNR